jgi:O-methyltransferase
MILAAIETPTLTKAIQQAEKLAITPVWSLAALAHSLRGVVGDIVECGAYRCGSTIALAASCPEKVVYSFDTFCGMPEVGPFDEHKAGDFPTTFEEVVANTAPYPNIILIKGKFADTVPNFESCGISLLFLDCDLYDSYKLCLDHFWPILAPGGMVVLEDYKALDCPGARKACDEFFQPEELHLRFNYVVAVKK